MALESGKLEEFSKVAERPTFYPYQAEFFNSLLDWKNDGSRRAGPPEGKSALRLTDWQAGRLKAAGLRGSPVIGHGERAVIWSCPRRSEAAGQGRKLRTNGRSGK